MSDITANLPSFQFEHAVEVCHQQFLHLRERSRGLLLNACCHAVFLCKLLDVISQKEEPESVPPPLKVDSNRERLKVGIIGCGHTGKQLARALLDLSGLLAQNIQISTRRPETLQELQSLGVNCFYDNCRLAAWAEVLFLCCLPSQLPNICSEIQAELPESSIVYSLVSAVPIARLKTLLCHSNILRPEYQYEANDDSHIWGTSGKITTALRDAVIVQATCPWHPGGGLAANARWFAAVVYAALNKCSNQSLSHKQSLQLLNNLLCHVPPTSQGEKKSCPSFVCENFVSQRFGASLQEEDAFPRFDLTAIHQKDTPFSKLLVSSPVLQDHLLQVYCTSVGVSEQVKENCLPSSSSEPCVSSQIPAVPVEAEP
ncbi:NADP-dependent oxidoreductase domain-containing protein 1 [Microcaecilia unicolor]|uniref:NADP-dependent oxidoreductase domain-containing protein 1 n=1 Tax=Microcaecilia unicolor TaxID=1415580 RepID=A0A6P7Z3E9_9AMPH|nr:NADP-dependent oxidoreductase domain-containing protein 1 [Microcaecilia unicolor]XP_030071231.1 NADP-dependent oxidoreductase domain-containing protein 1 [Microcaecilia unicolor]